MNTAGQGDVRGTASILQDPDNPRLGYDSDELWYGRVLLLFSVKIQTDDDLRTSALDGNVGQFKLS